MKEIDIEETFGNSLLMSVVTEFERGSDLIEAIDDIVYTQTANCSGSVGAHFRHNLDFINSFLNGIAERRIDFNDRERDTRIETDRSHARKRIAFAIERLRILTPEVLERFVMIRSEVDEDRWHGSTVSRELEFVHSHTVHHHALIREKLAGFGIAAAEHFGVAPSTLKFWEQQNVRQAIGLYQEKNLCQQAY